MVFNLLNFQYCLLIIGSPVISFFVSKAAFDKFDFTSINANIYSAVVAVISLHIALGMYLFKGKFKENLKKLTKILMKIFISAYSDDKPKSSQGKQD